MTKAKPRVVFMGTPDFASRILAILIEDGRVDIVAVYSRPDAVSKRGKAALPSAVSERALAHELALHRPTSLRSDTVRQELEDLAPALIVVAAYGMILPKAILDIPPRGCVNVHASILPRWRGAAPIERAILAGDFYTGVSIMQMEEGLDTGPYCAIQRTEVEDKSAAQLREELAQMGGELLISQLLDLTEGRVQWTSQDESKVSYADKIEKKELVLDPAVTSEELERRVRASSESAPARFSVDGRSARALLAKSITAADFSCGLPPQGRVRIIKEKGRRHVLLGCATGALELLELKPDSKKAMPATDWFNSFPKTAEGLPWA